MFKIIKTSTYKELLRHSEQRQELIDSLLNYDDIENMCTWSMTDEEYDEEYVKHAKYKIRRYELTEQEITRHVEHIKKLELQLHTLTAKKLPIKKSKNK